MVEQGYNYLDCPIHSMTEFFETRIENLEKSIQSSVSSRNKKENNKSLKKRKAISFEDFEDKDLDKDEKGKKLQVYWHVQTYYRCVHNSIRTKRKMVKYLKIEENCTKYEVNIII